jgi:methylated-DNA-[protein]-cysteine S-methyltransferase
MRHIAYCRCPVGALEIVGCNGAICAVNFLEDIPPDANAAVPDYVAGCMRQFDQYFNGTRRAFSVRLNPDGTDFQQRVWRKLQTIGFGEVASYGDIARAVGRPKAVRAVGGANGRNPIPVIIPCHRVIGGDRSLTGYGSGLWRKAWLLRHEGVKVNAAGRVGE